MEIDLFDIMKDKKEQSINVKISSAREILGILDLAFELLHWFHQGQAPNDYYN